MSAAHCFERWVVIISNSLWDHFINTCKRKVNIVLIMDCPLFFIPSNTVPSGLTVYLGRQSQELSNPNEVSRSVSQIIRHPDYSDITSNNDIALLKISSPVTFTDYIRPVCLAASGSTFYSGVDSWITGWGTIGSGREYCTVKVHYFNVSISYGKTNQCTEINTNS